MCARITAQKSKPLLLSYHWGPKPYQAPDNHRILRRDLEGGVQSQGGVTWRPFHCPTATTEYNQRKETRLQLFHPTSNQSPKSGDVTMPLSRNCLRQDVSQLNRTWDILKAQLTIANILPEVGRPYLQVPRTPAPCPALPAVRCLHYSTW